jgi:acetolactate synthase regulatory subunit
MDINRSQKEKRVIELYEQGKTVREIAEDVQMSFAEIISIEKKHTGEDKHKKKIVSKDSQALKLYSKGKIPLDVAFKLDLSADEACILYREFWKLKGLHQLDAIYEETKNHMPSFLRHFRMMRKEGFAEKDVLESLRHSKQLSSLGRIVDSRRKEIKLLEHQIQTISSRFHDLQEETEKLENLSEEYQSKVDELRQKTKIESARLKIAENSIADFKTSEDYLKINEVIESEVTSLLNPQHNLIMACVVTALLAIRNDPDKDVLIHYFDYYNNPRNHFSDTNNVESYIQANHPQLLETVSMFLDKTLKAVHNQIFHSLPKQ